ncbi:MAG: hypothetical protein H5T97_14215 [Firmicutes bacterium]|nr:hypothetical protein [Bacillota bacterium]
MTRELNYDDYARNRIRFRRMLFRAGRPGRRERPRDPEETLVLSLLARKRKEKWLREGRLVELGPREFLLR